MTQTSINYAKVLYELKIPETAITQTKEIFNATTQLPVALKSPIVSLKEKYNVIEKVFPKEMHSFLKVVCKNQDIERINEIIDAYKKYTDDIKGVLTATLSYVTMPDEKQVARMKAFLKGKFSKNDVELQFVKKPELIGGFVIEAGGYEIDRSVQGKIKQLQQKLVKR